MPTEEECAAVSTNELRGIGILRRLDQLDLPRPQILELLELEPGPQQRIREQLQHQPLVARQELPADRDGFGARSGVEGSTHPFDRIDKREGVTLARALLQQTRNQ